MGPGVEVGGGGGGEVWGGGGTHIYVLHMYVLRY